MDKAPKKFEASGQNMRKNMGYGTKKTMLQRESQTPEGTVFRTRNRPDTRPNDAVNDVLAGLIVSDSEPLTLKDRMLCHKRDMDTDGKMHLLPIARECIRPKTVIRFSRTIDKSMCPYTAEDILRAAEAFSARYNEAFVQKFKDAVPLDADEVLLGGGAGFVSKTILYPLFGAKEGREPARQILEKQFPKKHTPKKDAKVAPHTLKVAQCAGKTLQMGVCRLTIQEKEKEKEAHADA